MFKITFPLNKGIASSMKERGIEKRYLWQMAEDDLLLIKQDLHWCEITRYDFYVNVISLEIHSNCPNFPC